MSLSKKRPTFLRFVLVLLLGLLVSAGILFAVQQFYQENLEKSALTEPFLILAGISALLIAVFLVFPANRPARLIKWFWRLVVMLVLLAVLWGAGSLYIAQNDLLYMPGRRELSAEEALRANPQVEEVRINGPEQAVYHGYLWKPAQGRAGLVLYFGGNGELAAGRVYSLIRQNAAALMGGFNFMMVDYPGYGQSGGTPTEASIHAMAREALAYARTRADVDPNRLVIAGWSLGSGAATRLAAESAPAGLVLMAPFFNGTELAKDYLAKWLPDVPLLKQVMPFFVRNEFKNDQYAASVQAPTLVIAGQADTLIPFQQAERLAVRFPNGRLVTLAGDHNAPWVDMVSLQALGTFLQQFGGNLPLVAPVP